MQPTKGRISERSVWLSRSVARAAYLFRFKLDSSAGRRHERAGSRVFARGALPARAWRPSAAAGICWGEEEPDFRRACMSVRSSGTRSSPPLCVRRRVLDKGINFVHQRSQGRGTGALVAAPWWLCCSVTVIWSVSCGIVIESEASQINPKTSGLPARATSKSKGRSVVTFTQKILERAEHHVVPLFRPLHPVFPALQASLTVSQTPTGPQATSGCNSPFIPPSNTSA